MKSFTLIEILITLGILAILLGIFLPFGAQFYQSKRLQSESEKILYNLRRALFKSMNQEEDSSFGIYFSEDFYTLFKGENYFLRDPNFDEIFEIPSFLKIDGPLEIVFSKYEGLPDKEAKIILSFGKYQRKISINKEGLIDLEILR